MEDTTLDLENLKNLLLNVLKQMDEATRKEIVAVVDQARLEDMILETLGVTKQRLSLAEQEHLTGVIDTVLQEFRKRAGMH